MSSPRSSLIALALLCQAVLGVRWRKTFPAFLHNAATNVTNGHTSHEIDGHSGHEIGHSSNHTPLTAGPQCGVDVKVTSQSDKWIRCPEECPLYVEHTYNGHHCDFRCVVATTAACIASDPKTPVVDVKLGACRSCMVLGCDECAPDGTETCNHCSAGFSLDDKLQCVNNSLYVWYTLFAILGVVLILVIMWVVDLARREVSNPYGLKKGLELRSLAKLREAASMDSGSRHREVWSLGTNLLKTMVAGPGIVLDFNFQLVVIVWSVGVAAAWAIMATCRDPDLFTLGTRKGESAREMCIVVEWGFETQQKLMPDKVAFVFGLYVASFILALLHSIRQLHMFQDMDEASITHKDFCASLSGLPTCYGDEKVEEQLEVLLSEASGQKVVCASVAWDFIQTDDLVMRTVHEDLAELAAATTPQLTPRGTNAHDAGTNDAFVPGISEGVEPAPSPEPSPRTAKRRGSKDSSGPSPREEVAEDASAESPRDVDMEEAPKTDLARTMTRQEMEMWEKMGPMGKLFHYMEALFIHPTTQKFLTKGRQNKSRVPKSRMTHEKRKQLEADQSGLQEFLESATTCKEAFITFETETARDQAVEACKNGVPFKDGTLRLQPAQYEPDSILWKNFTTLTDQQRMIRLLIGIAVVLLATVVWTCVFYLPYAWFVSSSNYKYGQEPGFVSSMTFSMIVVLGNALMYLVCAEVADRVEFRYSGQRELCYLLLYAFACMFNVLLDLVFTYYIAYWMMVGSDLRTKDGTPLADLHTFTERFESYAMQRELGNLLWAYAVPSTFLIPFLIEPIVTIYAPYKIMSFIVRSHPEISTNDAEELLVSIPMDLSRYADIWLNVMLAVMIFWFPGGLVVSMFAFMAISHVWIYIFDHYRVLRSIPKCYYSSMAVDWWGQWMLGIPIGILLSCGVFKANCMEGHYYCVEGDEIVLASSGSFVIHMIVYTLLLMYFVPVCVKAKAPPDEDAETYKMCAQRLAPSFCNTNPMHCLRSEYIYEYDPPCDFCLAGKEHYMRQNFNIAQYFSDTKASIEDFSHDFVSMKDAKKGMAFFAKETKARVSRTFSSRPSTPDVKTPDSRDPKQPDSGEKKQ